MDVNIALIIPCYNEEKTIGKVIEDFRRELPQAVIYVCDNNSSDHTGQIAISHGAKLLIEKRQGKAWAVLRLLREVRAEYYIMVDGDDTYPAAAASKMLTMAQEQKLDMVVGDRLTNGTYKNQNKRRFHNFGNQLVKKLINRFFKSDLKDILSGYRVFSYAFVKNYSTLATGFELETDLSLFALHYNLGIAEVPIVYQDRPEGSTSKLNTFKDGIRIILTFFNLHRFYRPLSFFSYVAVTCLLISLILGGFPIYEFLTEGYVHRVPTAILATGIALIGLISFTAGLILDSIMRVDRKNTQLRIRNTIFPS